MESPIMNSFLSPLTCCLALACVLPGMAQGAKPGPLRDEAKYQENPTLERERQEEEARDRALASQKGEPYKQAEPKAGKRLTLDFSKLERPHQPSEFKTQWHLPPKRQWWTNTCWCFSTTSYLESEAKRISGSEVKLSEMFTVYWEYVEKVREFVRTNGASLLEEGSECGAVLLRWKQYGIVPEKDYTGQKAGETAFMHKPLIDEVKSYLDYVKQHQLWNEAQVLGSLRLILDKHLGKPPEKITVDGRELTPKQYLAEKVKVDPDAYVELMSFQYAPFWARAEYKVPDNWWHSEDYLNVPLEDWYGALKSAVTEGYTVAIGGDVSEPGYEGSEDVAIVPTFDLPQDAINQSSREFRFTNATTEDDHGIHIVGYARKGNHDWYLVKDSARSAQRGVPGYYFYREDYIRLKMLTFLVHKDAVKPLLAKAEAMGGKK